MHRLKRILHRFLFFRVPRRKKQTVLLCLSVPIPNRRKWHGSHQSFVYSPSSSFFSPSQSLNRSSSRPIDQIKNRAVRRSMHRRTTTPSSASLATQATARTAAWATILTPPTSQRLMWSSSRLLALALCRSCITNLRKPCWRLISLSLSNYYLME